MAALLRKRATAALSGFLNLFASASATAQMVPDWNGFYLGIAAGYARGEMTISAGDLNAAGISASAVANGIADNSSAIGFLGGQNFQLGFLVWGWEADWSKQRNGVSAGFTGSIAPFGSVSGSLSADLDWTSSLRARAGITLGDALIYGTAGIALARTSGNLRFSAMGSTLHYGDAAFLTGWAFGGGVEYQFAPSWTLRAEVIHTHIGDSIFSLSSDAVPLASSIDLLSIRAGLALRF